MAAEVGLPDPELTPARDALLRQPWDYEFFQAVRLLERTAGGREPVGHFVPPPAEAVRFGAHQSVTFPASEIQALEERPGAGPLMTVNFFGLTGPLGVLPLAYTMLVKGRLRERDTTLRDYFDLFNHRFLSFFYRAWEKYRFTVGYERDGSSPVSGALMALLGMGTPGLAGRHAVSDEALLFYSGLLGLHTRPAEALRQVLEDYFGVAAEVRQFAGGWHALAGSDQCHLGSDDAASGLGVGAVVGDEAWYLQSRVRLVLGPLTLQQYREFLPGGAAHAALRSFARLGGGQELDFEVQLVLRREEVPRCVMSDAPEEGARLGWVSWMAARPLDHDPADTVLQF